jgi:hypothetical protein
MYLGKACAKIDDSLQLFYFVEEKMIQGIAA